MNFAAKLLIISFHFTQGFQGPIGEPGIQVNYLTNLFATTKPASLLTFFLKIMTSLGHVSLFHIRSHLSIYFDKIMFFVVTFLNNFYCDHGEF